MPLNYIYDDTDSDNGHRDILLDPAYNVIKTGTWYDTENQVVFNASILVPSNITVTPTPKAT
ncbi:hypothetical protein [Levilactobacillus tongjiangensis]|uniref:SCP domain-containing protein n=1 Tax=Levilactobacillus tongjiangensis TaxID=2486023 RepID=A0ABW1SQW6_9LACO